MKTTYSTAPQAVSRYLAAEGFKRSRKVCGRLANYQTTGFQVRRVLGQTKVFYVVDHRENRNLAFELIRLLKVLRRRYEVEALPSEGVLILSEKTLAPGVLTFNRRTVLGESYIAETDWYKFVVRQTGHDKWELRVFTLTSVGFDSAVMVPDEFVHQAKTDTRDAAYKAAHEFLKSVS